MSHRSERAEKTCLNCSAFIYGRYCHKCGQENVEPKETFWHLVTHFTHDVTHFDGKFFSTAKYLLLKPGYLSKEYMKGKRMSYLNPIRMYVFTSAIFFVFFFSIVKPEGTFKLSEKKNVQTYGSVKKILEESKTGTVKSLQDKHASDSTKKLLSEQLAAVNGDIQRLQKDTSNFKDLKTLKPNTLSLGGKYSSVQQYDSAQSKLPADQKDDWLNRRLKHRKIALDQKYEHNTSAFINDLSKQFLHSFPQLFFVSLPLIALLLKLLYVRRKYLYYTDHIIYLVHLYCAMFIMLFVRLSFSKLNSLPHLHWLTYINVPIILLMFFYVYKSMRNFYAQRRAKTVFKFILLLFMSSLMLSFLFIGYGIISLFTV